MSVKSKRLRFEILKRDGFRCRYCGASAASSVLHVDHVVPESEGGEDTHDNLVTACADCNGGKSNIGLDESRIPTVSAEDVAQNAEDIRAYMEVCREQKRARDELKELAAQCYWDTVGPLVGDRISNVLDAALLGVVERDGFPMLIKGMEITAVRASRPPWLDVSDAAKYFFGVMKKLRAEPEPPASGQRFKPDYSDPTVNPYFRGGK